MLENEGLATEQHAEIKALRSELAKTKRELNAVQVKDEARKLRAQQQAERNREVPPTDPRRLFNNAVVFHEAGARCYREAPSEISLSKAGALLGAPSVVCYAFSIELYLKLLGLLTNKTYDKREH